jgi:hypothetical protein
MSYFTTYPTRWRDSMITERELMTEEAMDLNEAVVCRDLKRCRDLVRKTSSKFGASILILEAIWHHGSIADDRDWAWLANNLTNPNSH